MAEDAGPRPRAEEQGLSQRARFWRFPGRRKTGPVLAAIAVAAHSLVAFGVWAFELGSLSQVHTSSAVQVHGHDVEQLLGGFAHDW